MKPLYLIGTSADNKRLVLAKTKGAKFGSFSVPITPKLRKIFRELDEGRAETTKAASSNGAGEAAPSTTQATQAAPTESPSFEGMTGLSRRGGSAARQAQVQAQRQAASKAQPSKRGRQEPAPAPAPEPEPEPPRPAERRPAINSRYAPAQIQALLRQGKSARSVASDAGAPIEWVKRLMEPILLERMGIVEEMKRATYTKARKGRSVVPVGLSIIDNLRDRGVSFPERAAERGWTAHRPDGREWRVRFTYEHRGATRTAQWEYDPPTRSVVPLNALATQLSWRPDPALAAETDEGEGGTRTARRPLRRAPARKTPARKPAARGRSGGAAAKKSATRKPAAKKSATRKAAPKKSATRKPAAKKAPAKRSASRR